MQTDKDLIRKVHLNAFGDTEGEAVSELALQLLEDETARPMLSLVAELDDEIVGNIIFTSVKIEEGEDTASIYILAPLAVVTEAQGKGIGTELIRQGIKILKERGAEILLVLGDPNYYRRAGFMAGHNIKPPYKLDYPEAWMAQELVEGVLSKVKGTAQCAVSLSSPEYW